jgi:hypothetical protein
MLGTEYRILSRLERFRDKRSTLYGLIQPGLWSIFLVFLGNYIPTDIPHDPAPKGTL